MNTEELQHQTKSGREMSEGTQQDAEPLVQTSASAPRRRLTTRQLAKRRRHLLQLLLQQATQQTE